MVGPKIVLASSNQGKLKELQTLLAPHAVDVALQSSFQIPDADEIGLTFIENAIIKARHASHLSGLPALADDSGLVVDYLDGMPGVKSARFAGEARDPEACNEKLLALLRGVPTEKRSARYICVLVLLKHANDPFPFVATGTLEGLITLAPRGQNGFGYDPLFFIPSQKATAAEIDPHIKNKISHRAQAFMRLIENLELG